MTAGMIVDAPMLPGHTVRVREIRGVHFPYGKPRRWFSVSIDERQFAVVLVGGSVAEGLMACSEHEVGGPNSCSCKQALHNSGLLEIESPFAEKVA